jgi:tape measure domain-containing protein
MMGASNTIQLILDVDDRGSAKVTQFSSTLTDQVRKMSSGSAGHVQGLSQSFTKNLGGAIEGVKNRVVSLKTAAAAALVGWGVERLAGSFISTGASMDKMKLSLDTITKGNGEAWFKKLNDWAMTMPINTEKAIQSFIMMRAMGLQPSIADMTTLVDATSALGGQADTLEGIARALGQIQAKGKGSAEELMQLAERGVPVFEILKEKLGLTGAQIQDIGNQSVSSGAIIKAVMEGLAERFGGQSDKIQKKFSGLWEAMEGYWKEFQRLVMDSGVMRTIEAGLTSVNDKIAQMVADGSFQKWAEDVSTRVVAAFKRITLSAAGIYDSVMEYVPRIAAEVSSLWGAFTSFPEWIRDAGLIGAFIYGKKGAFALAAAVKAIQMVRNQAAGLGLIASGQMGFGEFAGMNGSELADYLREFDQENPERAAGAAGSADTGSASDFMRNFWAGFDATMAGIQAKASAGVEKVVADAETGLRNVQESSTETVAAEAAAALKIAEQDKKALESRLSAAEKYYSDLQGMIEKNAETEKKHVEELNALYRQQADIRKTTADQIRSLQEIGMSPTQKYESQKTALTDQYVSAMRLSGQEQVKALDEYKQALVSFGQTWSQGVNEVTENIITGSQTSVIATGKEIIDSVIADIEQATSMQMRAMDELEVEKQQQIEADRNMGLALQQSANQAVSAINEIQGVISELEARITAMQKVITITGDDQVSWVVNDISRSLAGLHDKTIHITTVYHAIGDGGGASSTSSDIYNSIYSAAKLNLPGYASGTDYVPRTGLYRLHEGEIVIPEEQSRQIRQRASLSGSSPQGAVGRSDARTVQIGDIVINIPESAAPQRAEDWREIARQYIVPELEKLHA